MPEKQFKKADFPVKKEPGKRSGSGQDSDNTSGDSRSRSNSRGSSGNVGGQPTQRAKDLGRGNPPPSAAGGQALKGWSVPRLEGGHVIAGGTGTAASEKPGRESKRMGSQPSGSAGTGIPASPAPAAEGKDMTRVYLSQLVGQDPRGATDILRSWYWEKPGRESPVKYVPPKNRIHLILRSLSKESLLALYEMMTPVERRQMEELRKEPMHVNDREILKVRQYFMARLTGQV